MKQIKRITSKQIETKGVQSLATRPNEVQRYGEANLTPTELKMAFDRLATFLAQKINEISDAFSGEEAAKYIRVSMEENGITDLDGLICAMSNGTFAQSLLMLYENSTSEEKKTLQEVICGIAEKLSESKERIEDLEYDATQLEESIAELDASLEEEMGDICDSIEEIKENIGSLKTGKLDKVTTPGDARVYGVSQGGMQMTYTVGEGMNIPKYKFGGQLSVSNPVAGDEAANKGYVDGLLASHGAATELHLDPSDYKLTVTMRNSAGAVVSSSFVDLPLESMKFGVHFENGKIILSYRPDDENELQTSEVDISDLVDGLVNTATFDAAVSELQGRINGAEASLSASVNGFLTDAEIAVSEAVEEAEEATLSANAGATAANTAAALANAAAEEAEAAAALANAAAEGHLIENEDDGKLYSYRFFVRDGHFGIRTEEITGGNE